MEEIIKKLEDLKERVSKCQNQNLNTALGTYYLISDLMDELNIVHKLMEEHRKCIVKQ